MYINIYKPTLSTLFFFNFFEPTLSTLIFFNFLVVNFVDIVFVSAFLKVYRPREVAHVFSREISRRMASESCLGTPWGRRWEHICKNMYSCQGRFGWDPWLKRASKTISNGVLKVRNAWILVNIMMISW